LEFGQRVVERLDVEIASPAPTHLREVTLNRAVAVAMVRGPRAGLDLLETLDAGELLTGHHRLDAVRAHLLEMAGEFAVARCCYRTAARRTTSLPEQRYLESRAARLAEYEQNSVPPA
jgi:predicted RNA polymerase sigma factor